MLLKNLFSVLGVIWAVYHSKSGTPVLSSGDIDLVLYKYLSDVNSLLTQLSVPELRLRDIHQMIEAYNVYAKTVGESLNFNDKCLLDILHYYESSKRGELWALKMFDSHGKVGSGILEGKLKWYGDFDECETVYAPLSSTTPQKGDFRGQYCTAAINVVQQTMNSSLSIGICLPDSCNPHLLKATLEGHSKLLNNITTAFSFMGTLWDSLELKLGTDNITTAFSFMDESLELKSGTDTCPDEFELPSQFELSYITCQQNSKTREFGSVRMWASILLALYIVQVVIGTFITWWERRRVEQETLTPNPETGNGIQPNGILKTVVENGRPDGRNENPPNPHSSAVLVPPNCVKKLIGFFGKCKNYFKCYSIISNAEVLFATDVSNGEIPVLHGIKTLAMAWIVWAHTFGFAFPSVSSVPRMIKLVDNWISQLILNAFYAVDIYFAISGMLVSFGYFMFTARNGGRRISWIRFYLHRLIRITPLYMLVVGIYAYFFPYMGSGPSWDGERLSAVCKEYWWTNLLFINNFYSTHCQCLSWAWYLANDMQFYFISPIFLFLLSRFKKFGYFSIVMAIGASCVATYLITYYNNLITGLANLPAETASPEIFLGRYIQYFDMIYVRPYSRIGPYLLGMILGHHLYERMQTNIQTKLNRKALILGWLTAISFFYYCLFGLYRWSPSLIFASFHNAFSRQLFSLGLIWFIYLCAIGQGGFINSFLCWKGFKITSRLNYIVFLLHPVLYTYFLGSLRTPLDLSYPILITYFLALSVATHIVAIVLYLLFEAPIMNIWKLARG